MAKSYIQIVNVKLKKIEKGRNMTDQQINRATTQVNQRLNFGI